MIFQFNNTELDTKQFTLSVDGQLKSIEPKVFDLIIYLIKNRSSVVTRQQLFDDLWEGRLVSDATLTNHIRMARTALGDDGEQQAIIKTIRSRGYQFIAIVEEKSSTMNSGSTASKESIKEHNSNKAGREDNNQANLSQKYTLKTIIGGLGFVAIVFIIIGYVFSDQISSTTTATTSKNLQTLERPYILVVPFSLSGADTDKWKPFADQMTREVIRNLRKISGLQVIPSSSAFTFRENKTASYVRQQLPKVSYILDAIISIGDDSLVRITPELDDIQSGKLIWDGDYQSRIDNTNIFDVQSKIAASVSDSLKIIILDEERKILGDAPTKNLAAYEFFVEGQHQVDILTTESLLYAIELYSKSIALDPSFEGAYIAKANTYRLLMVYFEKPIDMLPHVINSVIEALEVNPDSAEARSSLGLAYAFAWRWQDAWNMLNEAHDRNPNLALTQLGFALYYSGLGDKEGVHRSLANAIRLDPLNVEIADWGHWSLAMLGEIKEAIIWSENQIRLHPKVGAIYSGASVSVAISGDYERAIALAKKGIELDTSSFPLLALAQAYGFAGEIEKIRSILKEAEKYSGYTCPYESAIVYNLLGEVDRTFELLNDAIDYRSNCLVFILNDSRLESLRNDVRFNSILTRVGLDETSIKKYSR